MLQETHLTDSEHLKLKKDWVGQVYHASFNSRSRGVAILIHKSLPLTEVEIKTDKCGRYVLIKGLLYGEYTSFLNIYAPPNHPITFHTHVFSIFSDWLFPSSVVGGDLNCCLHRLDKSHKLQLNSRISQSLLQCLSELGLLDTWRTLHPNAKGYTFYSNVHKTSSRIDYFFTPKVSMGNVISCSIGNILISDHAPVFLEISCSAEGQYGGWRFKNYLLKDPNFKIFVRAQFQYFMSINKTPEVRPQLLWDTAKAFIRGGIISYMAHQKKTQANKRLELENQLSDLQRKFNVSPSPEIRLQLDATKTALETILTSEAEKSLLFCKQRMYEHGNKPSRYLANLVREKRQTQAIAAIKDKHGNRHYHNKDINAIFQSFYETLYKSETTHESKQHMLRFLSTIELPCLSPDESKSLNEPISEEELLIAIGQLNNNKAPGPDGLTAEFYKEFKDCLVEPLLSALGQSFEDGTLPSSAYEACISLIHKKGRPADECASFRPISLLNLDRKLLAKILATRLEIVMPQLVSADQTGFIKGRNSCNNVRRLLNLIQYGSRMTDKALVVSLDAEKAFDRIEMPYLFHILESFGLGNNFIQWVKVLYAAPKACVLTNGKRSNVFPLGRGTAQGCPLSPLLFALAIEPLAEAIRTDDCIKGIQTQTKQHKISLYADDILLYISKPVNSIRRLIELIDLFSTFSGYKINYLKSEAMSLSKQNPCVSADASPFRWSPSGFTYLGIHITPLLPDLYKANFVPLVRRIKQDLARWTGLPLSLFGRVHLFKMNILPRLLYPFQMVPILLTRTSYKELNSALISFLWRNKGSRLKLSRLQLPVGMGGLAVPNIKLYQLACQCRYIRDWFQEDPESTWLDIESEKTFPIPLKNILYTSKERASSAIKGDFLLQNTLKVWRLIRKIEGQDKVTSLLTPLLLNPDFPPSLEKGSFNVWYDKGIRTLGDVWVNGSMLSFNQLMTEKQIPATQLFRYFQVRSYVVNTAKKCQTSCTTSPLEIIFTGENDSKLVTRIYVLFCNVMKEDTTTVRLKWETDFGVQIETEDWDELWFNLNGCFSTNRAKELQFRITHRLHITPLRRNKMNPGLSKFCNKCKIEEGSYIHCLWDCVHINKFWGDVLKEINVIVGETVSISPLFCILGMDPPDISTTKLTLVNILLFCARRCILLKWVSEESPNVTQWINGVLEFMPLEALSFYLKEEPYKFDKIWGPFMTYLGPNCLETLTKGVCGLAWRE